jgi:flagellar biosynthesis GTPase FlhF
VLRLNPLSVAADEGAWQGGASLDLKTLNLEARGTLTARSAPKGWTGAPPFVVLGWRGPVAKPAREIEIGPLVNGLAAVVLQRELEKIEAFEADISERARLNQRRDMERARERARREAEEAARRAEEAAARQAAEEAARKRAAEEAARREEAARQVRLRQQQQEERARALPNPPPIDIRPAPQIQPPG